MFLSGIQYVILIHFSILFVELEIGSVVFKISLIINTLFNYLNLLII